IDSVRIDRSDQADAARKFVLTGIAQELSAGTEHDRQLSRIDVESFDQSLGGGVALGIEQLMRMAVAAEKDFKPQHIAVVGVADNDRAADACFEKADAGQN